MPAGDLLQIIIDRASAAKPAYMRGDQRGKRLQQTRHCPFTPRTSFCLSAPNQLTF
jgi:hypothetical protein